MIKIAKSFRPKGFYSTLLAPLARHVPNTIEQSYQLHFLLTTYPIRGFSTKSSELDSNIYINTHNKKAYVLRDHLGELERQPKEMLGNMLLNLQTAIEQKDGYRIDFSKEELHNANKIISKIQDGETREALRFLFHLLESAGPNKGIVLEEILKAAREHKYQPFILDEIANLMYELLTAKNLVMTDTLYEELKEFSLFVIPSRYFSLQIKERALELLSLFFEYNIKRGNATANIKFLEMLIDCMVLEKRGIPSKIENNIIYDDFSDYASTRPEKKVTGEQATKINEIVASYKQTLATKNENYSIDDVHNLALANLILNENSESLWELLLPHCQSEFIDTKHVGRIIIAMTESTFPALITVQSAKDCIFGFYEKVKKTAADCSLGDSVGFMEMFSITKMINYDLFEILNKNIQANFDQTNFKMLSKIIWIYSELPVSFSFEMPRGHLYHLIKQEYKKLTPNQFINLLLRLIKLALPNLRHDWKDFILLDGDLRAMTINSLNNMKFQNLTESEKIKLLFLYKTLAKTALSGFINESSVRMKLKPLLSSFIAFYEPKSSGLQSDVEETLQSMKANFSSEQVIDDVFSVDLIVEENFCVEVDGPHHFYLVKQKNEQGVEEIYHMETRSTWMKAHLLEIMGYYSRSVKYFEWQAFGNNIVDKRQYLRKLLREH